LYPVGYVTGLLARRFHTPHLTTIVGNDVKKYIFSPEKAALCRSGLENADIAAALSVDLMEMADALTPIREKTRIVYNSVEIPKQVWAKPRSGTFRVGCAGIFKYAKGLPYLLKACATLAQRRTIRLELVGQVRPSEVPILEEMLKRIGDRSLIELKPPMEHEKIFDWFLNIDAFVLPSLTEGCPNILMEAMAVGLPCVAARTGAVEELIEHGNSGLLVPWGDSHAIAEALERIISAPETACSLGAAARVKMSHFNAEHERTEWRKIYDELVNVYQE
jgi:glycosyltransferase involved in cell wall biosynthesis